MRRFVIATVVAVALMGSGASPVAAAPKQRDTDWVSVCNSYLSGKMSARKMAQLDSTTMETWNMNFGEWCLTYVLTD